MLLFQDPYRLFGSRNSAGQTGHIAENIDGSTGLNHRTNKTELQSFPGHCNLFWRFIRISAHIGPPLRGKQDSIQRFHFSSLSEIEIHALKTLQQRSVLPSNVALPRLQMHFIHFTYLCVTRNACEYFAEEARRTSIARGVMVTIF